MNTSVFAGIAQKINLECVEIFKGTTECGKDDGWLARPYPLLSVIRKGLMETRLGRINDVRYLRGKGSVFYCPPNVPRRHRILETVEFTAVLLSLEIPSGAGLENFWDLPFELKDNGLSMITERLYELREKNDTFSVLEQRETLLHLLRLLLKQASPRNEISCSFMTGRLAPALSTINSSYREKLEIRNLAALCGLSIRQFQILFKKQTGTTPSAFLRAKRLREAERMIVLSDRTLGEIADETGFYDAFELSRRFKIAYGISPSRYKKTFPATETSHGAYDAGKCSKIWK